MRRTARKADTSRSRPLQEDEEERIYKTFVLMDSSLTKMVEACTMERFWGMLNDASAELFNHIENAYEQQDRPTMQRLCDLLEDWTVKFQAGGTTLAMLFLTKALIHSEIDIEEAAKYVRRSKHVLEDMPNQHFISRIMLLEGDMYIGRDPKKAAACLIKCVTFCEKNAIYYFGEENYDVLQEMRTCLLTAYYKLAMLERANDDEQQTVIGYLQEAYKQAADLFGEDSSISRRLQQHVMQESIRSRHEDGGLSHNEALLRHRVVVYDGKFQADLSSGVRKPSNVCITYDTEQHELQIQSTTDTEGRKQKSQLAFQITLEPDQLRRLGSDLKWLHIRDNRIDVNDSLIKKITTGNPKMFYQLAQQIKKSLPRRSVASFSRDSEDQKEKELHSQA